MISLKSLTGFSAVTTDELFYINGGYGSTTVKVVKPKAASTTSAVTTKRRLVKRPIAHADLCDTATGRREAPSTTAERA